MLRDQGNTEQQAIAAVEEGRDKLDPDTKAVVRYFVRFGYSGNQTPDQAFASAEQKCRKYEADNAKKELDEVSQVGSGLGEQHPVVIQTPRCSPSTLHCGNDRRSDN